MPSTVREPVWKGAALLTGGFVVVLWLLEILDAASGNALDAYGVQPRSEDGLVGIAFAPLLHFGFGHLVSNTVPVVVLGFLTLATGIARGLFATAIIWVVGGLGVWVFAQPGSVHAGASVLVFGWIVYLVVRGFLNRNTTEILIGVVVFLLYSSALLGVLPGQTGVSWQGHLFGAVGGVIAARLLTTRVRSESSITY
ncbi:rhomboid family intramembrane serine protease [Nocardioides sp. zg-1308]|uniref:rhomboid family intramembrane serine protease n=1 Tax=Nocardioides TaxID=1839 RepID=UPI001557B8E2|nr:MULTISPECIES: rhomboid family intramembrane serine protease [unclassified Nocardioides]NPD04880.1 rhomboid family intramembrane serine protease [Nocardioides sp. zg-1308]WQQ22772.1 rhomboid family intramembrane serine protease [Nocardioides sp. S-34]